MNETNEILEQLFEKDYALKSVTLNEGKPEITAVVKTLSASEQIDIQRELTDYKESQLTLVQLFALKVLSRTIISYKGKTLRNLSKDDPKEIEASFEYFKTLPGLVIEKLAKEQRQLEANVRKALNLEEIEKTFFEEAPLAGESKPQSEESTSEKSTD